MARDIADLKGNIQKRLKARQPFRVGIPGFANPRQFNNNLLSFPYGDRFKKRKRTCESQSNCGFLKHACQKKLVTIEPWIAPGLLHGRGIEPQRYFLSGF
jgi:hypothetical protein